ncbi:MAG: flagellar biosynthesis protein FlhB [Sedimentisphaerales bacterium]|nr:flagellar biosynthesis protein FlhB [Sedimentisphaerales bacterium]
MGDKTEAPTPRRLEEAREKGQVAKSMDLSAAVGLLAGLIALNSYGSLITEKFIDMFQWSLAVDLSVTNANDLLEESRIVVIRNTLAILGPIFVVLFVCSLVINVLQVGFMLTGKPLAPSFEKISPISGFKRIFSSRSLVKTILSLAKIGIIGLVAGQTITEQMDTIVSLSGLDFIKIMAAGGSMTFTLGVRICLILLVLALIDYAYQKFKHHEDLKMSKEEVKEEMKRMEGDPYMRQRRRSVARQLASQRMAQAVPKADVVITNPTELALALKYDPENMPAPKLVAKGSGYMAQRIRRIALDAGVPIVERKPLARAMFKSCEVGDYIPPDMYKAVAEVLAYVFELNEKGFKKKTTTRKESDPNQTADDFIANFADN